MKFVSPIAIDMGAVSTGVFMPEFYNYESMEIVEPSGALISVNTDKIVFSQAERRAIRHQRRTTKRRKMAKRLFWHILENYFGIIKDKVDRKSVELLNGTFNRRGYTYFSEIDSEKITLIDDDWYKKILIKNGIDCSQFRSIENWIEQVSNDKEYLIAVLDKLGKFKLEKIDLEDSHSRREYEGGWKEVVIGLEKAKKASTDGHYHRSDYFKNIEHDINIFYKELNSIFEKNNLTPEKLFRLIAHINNLQLRVLRKYFNDNRDSWIPEKLHMVFNRFVRSIHPMGDKSVEEQRFKLLNLLKSCDDLIEIFLSLNPVDTIPPYEDQNNRNLTKCQSLLIDENRLTLFSNDWEKVAKSMLEFYQFEPEPELTDVLQRTFDRSSRIDRLKLRKQVQLLNDGKEPQFEVDMIQLIGENELLELVKIAQKYYKECESAARGDWYDGNENNILRVCGKNPPRKQKQLHLLLNTILPYNFSENEVEDFRLFLNSKFKGNSTFKGYLKRCSDIQKSHGNDLRNFLYLIENNKLNKNDSKDLKDIFTVVEQKSDFRDKFFKFFSKKSEHQQVHDVEISPFTCSQLYNILFKDIAGYSKTCGCCTIENGFRMEKEEFLNNTEATLLAGYKRLPADSVRPFDGVLAGIVKRNGKEIAKLKAKQLEKHAKLKDEIHIPIIIENNRFRFSEDLFDLKKRKKDKEKLRASKDKLKEISDKNFEYKVERIKKASNLICPYSGEKIVSGDIDHIVPRAYTKKKFNTILNSEANLIYCTTKGNTEKGKSVYTLASLDKRYLQAQFNTSNISEIESTISIKWKKLEKEGKNLGAFHRLSDDEQKTVRHSLFVESLRNRVINKLNFQTMSKVNGTQKYLSRSITTYLTEELKNINPNLKVTTETKLVDSKLTHETRSRVAEFYPELMKEKFQSAYSHVIDSVAIFVTSEGIDDDFKPLIPEEISIVNVQKKEKYLKKGWEQPIFKDSIYATNFVPFIVKSNGKVGFGFNYKDFVEINKNQQEIFSMLQPFFYQNSNNGPLLEVKQLSDINFDKRKYIKININNSKALDLLHKVAKEQCSELELKQADLLDAINYTTKKESVYNKLIDKNKIQTREKVFTEKNSLLTIDYKYGKTGKSKLNLPLSRDWKKFLDYIYSVNKVEVGTAEKEFDKKMIKNYFLKNRRETEFKHTKVRKDFSLPMIPSGAGAMFRVRRKNQDSYIWQLMTPEDVYEGFNDNGDKFNKTILMKLLRESKNIHLKDSRFSSEKIKTAFMNEWREIELPERVSQGVTKLEVSPGQSGRRYVKLSMTFEYFKNNLINSFETHGDIITDYIDLSSKFKIKDKTSFKNNLGFAGVPRTFIIFSKIGKNIVFYYESEGTVENQNSYFQK